MRRALIDTSTEPRRDACSVRLEPETQNFIDALAVTGGADFLMLPPAEARTELTRMQSGQIGKPGARIEDMLLPVGPNGSVRVRSVRAGTGNEALPVILYFHGGGWIAGDVTTHDRLIRELSAGTGAAVVFVDFDRAPESRFPIPIEEAYAATKYVAEHGPVLNIDGTRIAVAGDGTGGNMAAAVTLMAKERRGPKIIFQVLFYPVTDAKFTTSSYQSMQDGPWMTKAAMERAWDTYLPNEADRRAVVATPLNATIDQLHGLPDTLLITSEYDILRDEGEAYARRLSDASVRVTCTRYIGTIHDFVVLNAIADTPAARGAIAQANAALRAALE